MLEQLLKVWQRKLVLAFYKHEQYERKKYFWTSVSFLIVVAELSTAIDYIQLLESDSSRQRKYRLKLYLKNETLKMILWMQDFYLNKHNMLDIVCGS